MYSVLVLGVVDALHAFHFPIPEWVSPVATFAVIQTCPEIRPGRRRRADRGIDPAPAPEPRVTSRVHMSKVPMPTLTVMDESHPSLYFFDRRSSPK